MYIKNALAFNTLLSSQETRAHRQQDNDRRRGNLATVLRVLPDVNSVPRNFADPWDFPYHQDTNAPRSHGTRVAPDNGSLVAPRVASRLPAFRPSRATRTLGAPRTLVKSRCGRATFPREPWPKPSSPRVMPRRRSLPAPAGSGRVRLVQPVGPRRGVRQRPGHRRRDRGSASATSHDVFPQSSVSP